MFAFNDSTSRQLSRKKITEFHSFSLSDYSLKDFCSVALNEPTTANSIKGTVKYECSSVEKRIAAQYLEFNRVVED